MPSCGTTRFTRGFRGLGPRRRHDERCWSALSVEWPPCRSWTRPGSNRPPPVCKTGALPDELQAQMPLAWSGYSIRMGQASTHPRRPLRTHSSNSISTQRKGPATGPSRSSRTNPVRVSGTPTLSTTTKPASHRCVLGLNHRRWRRGSMLATLTRPASLHYSVVVQVLSGGRRSRTFPSLAGPRLD